MKVKRYIGKTNKEIMDKIKKELGTDAVILHTRKIKQSGFFGFFKKPLIEVVAAVDENYKLKNTIDDRTNKGINYYNSSFNDEINNVQKELNKEIKELKQLMENMLINAEKKERSNLSEKLMAYKRILVKKGVEEYIADEILNKINERFNVEDKDDKSIRDIIRYHIIEYLGNPEPIDLSKPNKIIFFIGPTGVGKTTTLAKIASKICLYEKLEVGIINADTYRIGAAEQIKTYGDILSIPVNNIYDIEDIYKVMSKLKDKEIILIDTAGRNHKDNEKIEEIRNLINSVNNKEVYLVLSATSSMDTIKSVIDKYRNIQEYKIIFTKLDEVDNLGIILNTRYYSDKPLSYFTTGQNVPDDIEIADVNKLSKYLIGEL
ncbi:flagellar biosynthesis protein FlhF [Caloranaerobacter azorensis DSM 13643]|uniref:Flagellar biosynthesis protein FlhF n=1 Tax=Caloranaerobacter azorensis DSM 13643 TaxID=1121264 RepID=A0A1M5RLD6_9FIRM|nr:flagellar biosynthesis protein FlhF [Caloranaerobacter azorensis]SHH26966.1 flagellar biosynthesis protein FlhF [Caloranaerobacter azorensis DSM 13643]